MKTIKNKKGFSLVELLIVMTIIALLTTIILNSISNSRARAYDSKVKQQLVQFRTSAEVYFSNQNPNSYGPTVNVCSAGIFADTSVINGAPGKFILAENLPFNTQVVCGSNGSSYAVKASLYSGNQYFCIDNRGSAKVVNGEIGVSVTSCP